MELGYNISALTSFFFISFTPKIRIFIFEILNCLHSETQDGKRVEPADELHWVWRGRDPPPWQALQKTGCPFTCSLTEKQGQSWCFAFFPRPLWQTQEPNFRSLFFLHNMFRPSDPAHMLNKITWLFHWFSPFWERTNLIQYQDRRLCDAWNFAVYLSVLRIWTGQAPSPLRSSCPCQSCSKTRS